VFAILPKNFVGMDQNIYATVQTADQVTATAYLTKLKTITKL